MIKVKKVKTDKYQVTRSDYWFRGGKWVEKRKRPLFHTIEVLSLVDDRASGIVRCKSYKRKVCEDWISKKGNKKVLVKKVF